MSKYRWNPVEEMDMDDGTHTCYSTRRWDRRYIWLTQNPDGAWDVELSDTATPADGVRTLATCKTLTSAKRWAAMHLTPYDAEPETTEEQNTQPAEAANTEMEEQTMTTKEITTARAELIRAHKENTSPAETVREIVRALGEDAAREIVADMVTACGAWDGRISGASRAWAAENTTETRESLQARYVFYCDDVHPCHMEQIARAMMDYQPEPEPAQEPEQQPEPQQEPQPEPEQPAAPDYLDEEWPHSVTAPLVQAGPGNYVPGVYYTIEYQTPGSACVICSPAETVDDLETLVQQIKSGGGRIRHAWRHDRSTGARVEFIPESRQDRTDRENRERCRRISDELDVYAQGRACRCPECGEVIEIDDLDELETENEDGATVYRLPCGCETECEPEQLTLYDYFEDALDIEYRCDGRREYRSVSVMVACGGPNIYIDTDENAVLLYWWGDRARYDLDMDTAAAVDEWAQEYWDCM